MRTLRHLFEANRQWSERLQLDDPEFFPRLTESQVPRYLWIGCSDSRVAANQIIGTQPGEVFVHRNVANVVVHTDFNCLSVLQYAVEVLKVTDVIVCGHYGCGGVKASMEPAQFGLIDNWLRHIRDVQHANRDELLGLHDDQARVDRLCELNVAAQVGNVCRTTIVQNAWARGQPLAVHGWIYALRDGLLRNLDLCVDGAATLPEAFRMCPPSDA